MASERKDPREDVLEGIARYGLAGRSVHHHLARLDAVDPLRQQDPEPVEGDPWEPTLEDEACFLAGVNDHLQARQRGEPHDTKLSANQAGLRAVFTRLRARVQPRRVSREDSVMDALGGVVGADTVDAEASRRVFREHARPVRPKVSREREALQNISVHTAFNPGASRRLLKDLLLRCRQIAHEGLGLQIEGEDDGE